MKIHHKLDEEREGRLGTVGTKKQNCTGQAGQIQLEFFFLVFEKSK